MLLSKQLENSNVLYARSLNVKVSADVGTGRYCLWGGSYQEIVYCIVLNSKFTLKGLSSKRFKLLKVKLGNAFPDKTKAFASDR